MPDRGTKRLSATSSKVDTQKAASKGAGTECASDVPGFAPEELPLAHPDYNARAAWSIPIRISVRKARSYFFEVEEVTSRNGPWSSGKLLVFRI